MKCRALVFAAASLIFSLGCLSRIGQTVYRKPQMYWVDLKPIAEVPGAFLLRASEPVNSYAAITEVKAELVGRTLVIRPLLSSVSRESTDGSTLSHEQLPEHGWCFVYLFRIGQNADAIALGEPEDVIWTRKDGFLWKAKPETVPASLVR